MADLADTIAAAALDPSSASVDGQSVTARPVGDLIAADQYLAARAGVLRRRRGIRFTKILPAGPVSDQAGSGLGPEGRWC